MPDPPPQIRTAYRAITDKTSMAAYLTHGHPDGPIVLSLWSALPDTSTLSARLAFGAGVAAIAFIVFALYAWFANKRHEKQEVSSSKNLKGKHKSATRRPRSERAAVANPSPVS